MDRELQQVNEWRSVDRQQTIEGKDNPSEVGGETLFLLLRQGMRGSTDRVVEVTRVTKASVKRKFPSAERPQLVEQEVLGG